MAGSEQESFQSMNLAKVVVDTNVFISFLLRRAAGRRRLFQTYMFMVIPVHEGCICRSKVESFTKAGCHAPAIEVNFFHERDPQENRGG